MKITAFSSKHFKLVLSNLLPSARSWLHYFEIIFVGCIYSLYFLILTCLHCFSSTCFVCSWSSARSLSLFSRFFSFSRFFMLYIKSNTNREVTILTIFIFFTIPLGNRDCAVRLPPIWQGFDSGSVPYVGFRLSLLLVLALPWEFLSGISVFPPPKINISKFQFDQDKEKANADVGSSLNFAIFWFNCV